MVSRAGVLVVGGAGFIGSALVRRLAAHGPVRVLDDLSTGRRENLEGVAGAELCVGSILSPADVSAAMDGVRTVFHLACRGVRHSISRPAENHEINATGTLRLLEEARRRGVGRFVYTSTSEVYGTGVRVPMDEDHPTRPHTVYGGSKLAGEAYTRAYHDTYGMPTIVIRPFNAYGPRSHHEGDSGEVIPRFLVRVMNGRPPVVFGDGLQTRDFTFVEDTARGIEAAARCDDLAGRTVNLGTGTEVTIADLARAVAEAAARPGIAPVFEAPRPGDVRRLVADCSLARDLFGWHPELTLADGLAALVRWHRETGTDWAAAERDAPVRNWE